MDERLRDLPLADYVRDLHDQHRKGLVTRQEFLRWGAMVGASLPLLKSMAGPAGQALAAGRTRADMTPQMGGTLRCTSFQTTQIEPPLLEDVSAAATVQAVCEQLVRVGPDLIPRPHLAKSWTASADAKTWTFQLQQGVTFNNGQPFTADDVVWTFQMLLDPKTASSARSTLSYMTMNSIEKVDQYTVRFHLNRPVAIFPYDIDNYMVVMLPKNWPGSFIKNPIGTGPYMLKEWLVNDHATFTRNPNYWRKPLPYLDGLHISYTATDMAAAASLIGGQSDVFLFPVGPIVQTLQKSSKVTMLHARSAAYSPFHMRSDMKPFSDNRVREAFKYAVNRQQLIQIEWKGYADIGNDHMVAPVFPEYTSNGVRPQDYAKAKALLAAAGYPDGIQVDLYDGSIPTAASVALQQMVLPAGIKIRLRPDPNYGSKDWNVVPFGITGWVGRPTVNAMLNLAYRTGVPWNESHWSDPAFDTLLDQLDATVEMDKRKAIARQIEDIMTHQGPVIIWSFEWVWRATRSNVRGIVASPISHADLDQAWLAKM